MVKATKVAMVTATRVADKK
jgi:hypothetical protein